MTIKVGIRDLARNSNILDDYDYVEVEDKKTHEYKGLFVSAKYADEFKSFLDKKIYKQRQEKLQRAMKYAGKGDTDERFANLTSSQVKQQKSIEKYGEK